MTLVFLREHSLLDVIQEVGLFFYCTARRATEKDTLTYYLIDEPNRTRELTFNLTLRSDEQEHSYDVATMRR